MSGLFEQLQFWHWWILAVLLLGIEVMAPGTFFLWLAVAAAATGLVGFVAPIGWQGELVAFALLSLVAVIAGRAWMKRHPTVSEDEGLNKRGQRYIGQVFTVAETFQNGRGAIKVGDTVWRAEGPALAQGDKARVVAVEGALLKVERVG